MHIHGGRGPTFRDLLTAPLIYTENRKNNTYKKKKKKNYAAMYTQKTY